jgi:hypothetical protein
VVEAEARHQVCPELSAEASMIPRATFCRAAPAFWKVALA